jgi:hypothetical protein
MKTLCVMAAVGMALAATGPAVWAQKVILPRAKEPVLLCGFKAPDAASHWTGTACSLTANPELKGNSALAVRYPKWDGKSEPQYIPATIGYADGAGYPVKDWSHFGVFAFDAWVDGPETQMITVELSAGDKVYTKELYVEPGRRNAMQLSLEDARDVVDTSDVRAITIYGIRPKRDTVMTLDNLRLLPGDKGPLADFDLIYPNYREMVFPHVSAVKVGVEIHAEEHPLTPKDVGLSLSARAGAVVATNGKVQFGGNRLVSSVSVAKLPPGPIALTAKLVTRTGKVLASREWTLRKITKAEAASLKVYIDERNNLVADGKPFFPIGWFCNTNLDQLEEMADSPFNTVLPYGANTKSKAYMQRYMDLVQQHGMKIIYCMNDVYPTATYLEKTGWEGVKGNDAIAHAVVKAYRNHPAVLSWYINDERPKELLPKMLDYYRRVRADDPGHPTCIVIYQWPEVKYYGPTTDIMGVDRYPVPQEPITMVRDEMRVSDAGMKGIKPTWAVIQAFGWYQYNAAFPDRGRIPTEAELETGRAPTYDESRCMTYLALANGAKGLLYYCYYDMRVLPQYSEMWAWHKKLAAEVRALSPILLEAKDLGRVACTPSQPETDTRLLDLDGHRYLIAVNPTNEERTITFDVRRAPVGKVSVMFEGRFAMAVDGTKLTDTFKPLEAHVYSLG